MYSRTAVVVVLNRVGEIQGNLSLLQNTTVALDGSLGDVVEATRASYVTHTQLQVCVVVSRCGCAYVHVWECACCISDLMCVFVVARVVTFVYVSVCKCAHGMCVVICLGVKVMRHRGVCSRVAQLHVPLHVQPHSHLYVIQIRFG